MSHGHDENSNIKVAITLKILHLYALFEWAIFKLVFVCRLQLYIIYYGKCIGLSNIKISVL